MVGEGRRTRAQCQGDGGRPRSREGFASQAKDPLSPVSAHLTPARRKFWAKGPQSSRISHQSQLFHLRDEHSSATPALGPAVAFFPHEPERASIPRRRRKLSSTPHHPTLSILCRQRGYQQHGCHSPLKNKAKNSVIS